MTFSEHLKQSRARLGYTQKAFSKLLGVPDRTLWDWEHGVTTPLPVTQEGTHARIKMIPHFSTTETINTK